MDVTYEYIIISPSKNDQGNSVYYDNLDNEYNYLRPYETLIINFCCKGSMTVELGTFDF